MQFGPLEAGLHSQAVHEWLERTRYIAEDHLDECYRMAMDAHATRSPLIPRELNEQWGILRQRGVGKPQAHEEKRCRFWCSADGWIVVDAAGELVKEGTKKPEYTYAKPCPDHRPKGVKLDPQLSSLPRPRFTPTMFVSGRKDRPGGAEGFKQMVEVATAIVEQFDDEPPF